MSTRKFILFCATLSLGASAFGATISIGTLQADRLKDFLGVAIPQTSLYMLVASTTDTTFASIGPGTGTAIGSSILTSGDDYVIYRGNLTSAGTNGVLDASASGLQFPGTIPNWDQGDALALVWFPTLTLASTTIPAGTKYGIYTRTTTANGSAGWATPAGGASINLFFYTTDGNLLSPGATAVNAPATANATLTVVPEPTSLGLLGLGLIGLVARRRRSAV